MKLWLLFIITAYLLTEFAAANPFTTADAVGAPGCYDKKGIRHDFGPFKDPEDVCNLCVCHEDGDISCKKEKCPKKLPCKSSMRTKPTDQCCEGCRCFFEDKKFDPGPLEHRCNCSCDDGGVTCDQSHCPKPELMCPNPTLDKYCCLTCPKGPSCTLGRRVVPYGRYYKVGYKRCTCGGDPWFPNAFCAATKVGRSLAKKYKGMLVDFSLPGIK